MQIEFPGFFGMTARTAALFGPSGAILESRGREEFKKNA